MTGIDFAKWLAMGTGIGIEIGSQDLTVTVVRLRPTGVRVLGELTIPHFREQPAAEWGAAYAGFLQKLGVGHLAATILLPRDEVTVRQIALPGVTDKDLASAVRFEIDSLNPHSEEEVAYDWARIGKTSSVLIAITLRSVVERYTALFSQAGVKAACFTFSAPTIYSALRLLSTPPKEGFPGSGAGRRRSGGIWRKCHAPDLFGAPGSAVRSRPDLGRVRAQAAAGDRSGCVARSTSSASGTAGDIRAFARLSFVRRRAGRRRPPASAQLESSAAGAARSPHPGCVIFLRPFWDASSCCCLPLFWLIPAMRIVTMSDWCKLRSGRWIRLAKKAAYVDRETINARNRSQTLDNFRQQTRQDLDALNELTHLLAPPAGSPRCSSLEAR